MTPAAQTASCPECTAAVASLHHIFRADCLGCTARAVARSQAFSESRRTGKQTSRYIADLERCGVTHEQVKQAAASDFMTQSQRGQTPHD